MQIIESTIPSRLPQQEDLAARIVSQLTNRRVQQVGAAVLFSVVGATTLVLIDGASKRSGVSPVQTAFAKGELEVPVRSAPDAATRDRLDVNTRAVAAPVAPKVAGGSIQIIADPSAPAPSRPLAMADASPSAFDAGVSEPPANARGVRTQTVTAPVAATAAAKPPANNIATAATAIPWQDPPDAARAATPAEAEPAPVAQTPASKAADGAASATAAGLPACLPTALQNVLSALETRFPRVKVVSTTHLHTDNHSHGSVREKLHLACKAIDIKIPGDAHQITAFLHARPEVGGVNAYRNHVVHFDLSAKYAKTGDRVAAAGSRAGH